MRNAGARRRTPASARSDRERIVAFAGPGNNGGDAFSALAEVAYDFDCIVAADPGAHRSAARVAAGRAQRAGVRIITLPARQREARRAARRCGRRGRPLWNRCAPAASRGLSVPGARPRRARESGAGDRHPERDRRAHRGGRRRRGPCHDDRDARRRETRPAARAGARIHRRAVVRAYRHREAMLAAQPRTFAALDDDAFLRCCRNALATPTSGLGGAADRRGFAAVSRRGHPLRARRGARRRGLRHGRVAELGGNHAARASRRAGGRRAFRYGRPTRSRKSSSISRSTTVPWRSARA